MHCLSRTLQSTLLNYVIYIFYTKASIRFCKIYQIRLKNNNFLEHIFFGLFVNK